MGMWGQSISLAGLLKEPSGTAGRVLEEFGVEQEKLLELIDKLIAPSGNLLKKSQLGYSPQAQKIIENAAAEAEGFGQALTGTEHLLLAMLKESDRVATRLLYTMGGISRSCMQVCWTAMGMEGEKSARSCSLPEKKEGRQRRS